MKISVKGPQTVFTLDVEKSDTVTGLKEKIHEAQGHPPNRQKLIFSGKILPDNKTVESCEIKEKDVLTLTVTKAS